MKHNFELICGLIIVDAEYSNLGKRKFVLDTGSSDVVLNKKYVESLGGDTSNSIIRNQGAMMEVSNSVDLIIDSLVFLGKTYTNLSAIALDLSYVENSIAKSTGKEIEIMGVVGLSVIKNFTLAVDYPNSVIYCNKDKSQFKSHIDFFVHCDKMVVEANIFDEKLNLFFDTGANANLIDNTLFEKFKCNDVLTSIAENSYNVGDITVEIIRANIKEIILADKTVCKNQLVVFNNVDSFNKKESDIKVSGVLGSSAFIDKTILLDFNRNKIYFN